MKRIAFLAVMMFGLAMTTWGADVIKVSPLKSKPVLDGAASDWDSVPGTTIRLNGKGDVKSVTIKAGVYQDQVYFVAQWADSEASLQHRPFQWDGAKKRYQSSDMREDRLALQFAMSGDYTAEWDSGRTFTADMWHWKASRSNPLGVAHDKMTIVTTEPSRKAYRLKAKNGTDIYLSRPSDAGDKLYTSVRYSEKEADMMPKYKLAQHVTGSIADVKAKGVWANGAWTLELQRAMDTGHDDDVAFEKGKAYKGAVAVFNAAENSTYNFSGMVVFQF